ncbi:MAG: hypothetical protein PHX21_05235 [bacterium]|nr:hypothetical protein [bacterium]
MKKLSTIKISKEIKEEKEGKMKRILQTSLGVGFYFYLLAAVLTVVGCGRNKVTDEEAVETIVRSSEWFQCTSYQENDSSATNQSKGKGDTLGDTLFWWRSVPDTGRHYTVNVQVSGDSAFVSWTLTNDGKFNIIGKKNGSNWWAGAKPLEEVLTRNAIFLRTGDRNNRNKGWELKQISKIYGYSQPTHTVRIDSIRIQCATYPDTILKDPSTAVLKMDRVMKFSASESVTVTLYTNTNTGEAYLHVFEPIFPYHCRILMKNNGDGSYTNAQKWCIQTIPSVRHAVFDLINVNTIHDTEYAYDCDDWFYPYSNK